MVSVLNAAEPVNVAAPKPAKSTNSTAASTAVSVGTSTGLDRSSATVSFEPGEVSEAHITRWGRRQGTALFYCAVDLKRERAGNT